MQKKKSMSLPEKRLRYHPVKVPRPRTWFLFWPFLPSPHHVKSLTESLSLPYRPINQESPRVPCKSVRLDPCVSWHALLVSLPLSHFHMSKCCPQGPNLWLWIPQLIRYELPSNSKADGTRRVTAINCLYPTVCCTRPATRIVQILAISKVTPQYTSIPIRKIQIFQWLLWEAIQYFNYVISHHISYWFICSENPSLPHHFYTTTLNPVMIMTGCISAVRRLYSANWRATCWASAADDTDPLNITCSGRSTIADSLFLFLSQLHPDTMASVGWCGPHLHLASDPGLIDSPT
jgi:hypothetical protein